MAGVTHRLEAHVLGEGDWIGATEICRLCWLDLGAVMELAELGVVAPRATPPGEWQIPATALPRLRVIGRLMRDLGVNVSGAALALELLEARRQLERRIRALELLVSDH
ncbi:MAG: MerR family transcriptional regulator [Gammaproteobacteria bacterium]|nr:MAG: MerR family transcriptional regulator [Gammaproteobacteria bacterium]TLZ03605.1 MAG: MerR family transcriptional regulator [Gammaproteobacteria bacterium]TLZ40035.1 MAG: MerR family transcriptional regulator [Gammaproteobacteria bacterium]